MTTPLSSGIANRVFGQPDFNQNTVNTGGVSGNSMNYPYELAIDPAGRLFVADGPNNRVLLFNGPLISSGADLVFGQPNLTSNTANNGGLSAGSMRIAGGVALGPSGRLYVTDAGNSRVLQYDPPFSSSVGGIAEQPDVAALPSAAASSGRDHMAYLLGAAGAFLMAAALAAGWRMRRT
jgi:NHL repeat